MAAAHFCFSKRSALGRRPHQSPSSEAENPRQHCLLRTADAPHLLQPRAALSYPLLVTVRADVARPSGRGLGGGRLGVGVARHPLRAMWAADSCCRAWAGCAHSAAGSPAPHRGIGGPCTAPDPPDWGGDRLRKEGVSARTAPPALGQRAGVEPVGEPAAPGGGALRLEPRGARDPHGRGPDGPARRRAARLLVVDSRLRRMCRAFRNWGRRRWRRAGDGCGREGCER